MMTRLPSIPTRAAALARRVLAPVPVQVLALVALCSAYLQGGLVKATDFAAATAEMRRFGLEPAGPVAALVIALELGASAMILTGRGRWPGALLLAGFTLLASLRANAFWTLTGPDRLAAANAFFEHLGLAGALVLVARSDLARADARTRP